MKNIFILLLAFSSIAASAQEPMKIDPRNSANFRWLNKGVKESKLLDNMENSLLWTSFTGGEIALVDSRTESKAGKSNRNVTTATISENNAHSGSRSLLLRFPSKIEIPGPRSGRGWGNAGVWFTVNNEDLTAFNRISVWIYPDNPGAYANWVEMRVFNEGKEKLPAPFGQEGETTISLNNQEWNHIVWEIGNVARDRISKIEISSIISGNEPEANDTTLFYIDDLELQKVDPDYIEGWSVWPGRIAFSHTGYLSDSPKSAIGSNLNAGNFSLIDEKSGKAVLNKEIRTIKSGLGIFQILDFSEITKPGLYHIQAGEISTRPFRIDNDVWEQTIWKALNFYYAERCGIPIPGVHGTCHRDWTCVHGDKRIVINGGWHDAGDLTQGLRNTGEAVYALFGLAEKVRQKGNNPELYERILDEAKWGLDWILKTSFGDGFRNEGSINSRRTNGIIGDYDDVTSTARNNPKTNFIASSAEAIAYRVLKENNPRLATYSLRMARADWQFAVDKMVLLKENDSTAVWSTSFDSGDVLHEIASAGILASVELWNATKDKRYADKAVELADIITGSQQRKRTGMNPPLTGFFYTGPSKKYILHYCHNGREQEPVAALTLLCEAIPGHPDWMKWYSAVVLHSEYLKTISRFTEPYFVMPSSIYKDKDYLQVPESRKESFRKQVLNGIPLGNGNYLRIFPVWMDYRGHFGTILPQAQSLAYAARLRGNPDCKNLAVHQLEWITGLNPFSQCEMYGEGYDFPPLYSPSSGDITGALPVGIQTRAENDVPYWPVQNTWTYKEVWIHPVSQWIGIMRELEGLSLKEAQPVMHNNTLKALFSKTTSPEGDVKITATIEGEGEHLIKLRTSNLTVREPSRSVILKPGKKIILKWSGRTDQADEPWVALVVDGNDESNRWELTGSAWEK